MVSNQRDVDFMYVSGKSRFRCNAFFQQRGLSISLRLINESIFTIEQLGLPQICKSLCEQTQGLVLVVGPTGHGKSTSLAAMIDYINETRAVHMITIEDPVEFIFKDKMSTIEQRELNYDTVSFKGALKAAMRQDPDILMVGEMRDLETIRAAITLAETGHLVFATLHTNSAPLAIDRLIDVFPPSQQSQVRLQLSTCLSAIISQRLLPIEGKGRALAYEVMIVTNAIRNMIRDENVHMIPNVIQTSAKDGMISLDKCLSNLVLQGIVSYATACEYAQNRENLKHLVGTENLENSTATNEDVDEILDEDIDEDLILDED